MFARILVSPFVVVLTLALGIGANTAIFSLIDALMLRSLPVRHPQELVQSHARAGAARAPGESFSYAIVRALAEQRDIFAASPDSAASPSTSAPRIISARRVPSSPAGTTTHWA